MQVNSCDPICKVNLRFKEGASDTYHTNTDYVEHHWGEPLYIS